jgi:hypothetical protein
MLSVEVPDTVRAEGHFPTDVGTTWTYVWTYKQLSDDLADTVTTRWTETVSIVEIREIADGLLAVRARAASDLSVSSSDGAPRPAPDRPPIHLSEDVPHLFLRGPYAYELRVHPDLAEQWTGEHLEKLTPVLFFPMSAGLRWSDPERQRADYAQVLRWRRGEGGAPNPGMYYWIVENVREEDVLGRPTEVFQLVYRTIGGPSINLFAKDIGFVRRYSRHAGTYWETEGRLVDFRRGRE